MQRALLDLNMCGKEKQKCLVHCCILNGHFKETDLYKLFFSVNSSAWNALQWQRFG